MQTKTTIQFWEHFNALLNLLLLQQWPLCRWFCFDQGLCTNCWQRLVFVISPFCHRCGQLLAYAIGDQLCGSCFAKAPPLPKIRSCFLSSDWSRQLILKKMVTRFISTLYLPAFYKRLSPP
jgi:predicted amidophosphoribosyltransferase